MDESRFRQLAEPDKKERAPSLFKSSKGRRHERQGVGSLMGFREAGWVLAPEG